MAVVAEELVSDLIVRDGKLRAGVRSAQQTYGRALGDMRGETKRFESEFNRSSSAVTDSFKRMAGVLAAGISVRAVTQLVDSYTRLQNNLRVAGLEGEKLVEVQENLLGLSRQYGVDIETLSGVFLKASLAQDELGASTEQIINLNEIVAASLKITGTSADEARGALLQLGQAIGSDIVRGEEFNSLLENALPIVQAAARGIDRFEGSVTRLRQAVVEGEVSSREFFEGVLAGGVQTIADAEKATLTLSGAFEALGSSLTVYVGEAAKANGVTSAMAAAIKALADNLDTIIPVLAVISAALGIGFVKNVIAARVATISLTASLRGMLALMGGPVGLAITALTLGLGYVITNMESTRESTERLKRETEALANQNLELAARLKQAGIAVEDFGDSADRTAGKVSAMATSFGIAIDRAFDLISALNTLEARETAAELASVRRNISRTENAGAGVGGGIIRAFGGEPERGFTPAEKARLEELKAKERALTERQNLLFIESVANSLGIDTGGAGSGGGSGAAPSAGGGGTARSGRAAAAARGPDIAEIENRFASEIAGYAQQTWSAWMATAASADERAELELRGVELARQRTFDEIATDADYSDAQKERLRLAVDVLAEAERGAINFARRAQLEQEAQDIAYERQQAAQDALRLQYELATTEQERRDLALQILDAEDRYLQSKLESIIASETATDAEKERARIALESLKDTAGARRDVAERAHQGALGRYAEDAQDVDARIEQITAERIRSINDSITNALTEELGIEDPFIKGLLSTFLEANVFGPLAEALSEQSGTGGVLGSVLGAIGGLFGGGRAGGGSVNAGRIYRVNEGQQEFFQPATDGRITPLSQAQPALSPAGRAGAPVIVQLAVAPGELFRPTVEAISGDVSVRTVQAATPGIVRAAGVEVTNRFQRPRT